MRRGNFRDDTVDYAAVGATSAPDLMHFPPNGSKPAEGTWRIGSGEQRFTAAAETLLSWGVQRGAGLQVLEVRPADTEGYTGVSFDADGKPIAPARAHAEQRFDANGVAFVAPGATVTLRGRIGGANAGGQLRVVGFSEQPRHVGFALGTVGHSVVSGEESFDVVWREDNDEVWFTVRAFDTPHSPVYKYVPGLTRYRRKALFEAYHRAISPVFATP